MNITVALKKGVTILLTVFLIVGCDSNGSVALNENTITQPKSLDNGNSVTLNSDMVKRFTLGKPKFIEFVDTLQVPSNIEVNQYKIARIGANITGRIVKILARVGDNVKAGTALAQISSPELTQAQLAYLRAYSQAKLAERAAERAHQLFASDVIASAELQRRQSELQVMRAELSAATDHLRMLNVSKSAVSDLAKHGQILPSVAITASKSGTVIEQNVAVGQVIQPADQLFLVADLSTVWIVGGVPEQNASNVMEGQQVEVYVPALNNARFNGFIVFVADTIDPETRTVTVRTQVKNKDRKLKPAMLAIMHITGSPKIRLAIPNSAVVREYNRNHIFIAQGDNRFTLKPVELSSAVKGMRPILSGVDADQQIIIDGAFHVNNQRKRSGLD